MKNFKKRIAVLFMVLGSAAGVAVPKTSHALIIGLTSSPVGHGLVIAGAATMSSAGLVALFAAENSEGGGFFGLVVFVVGAVLDEDRSQLSSTEFRNLEDYLRDNQYAARNPEKRKKILAEFDRLDASVKTHEAGQKLACETHHVESCHMKPLQIDLRPVAGAKSDKKVQFVQKAIKDFYQIAVSEDLAGVLLEMNSSLQE